MSINFTQVQSEMKGCNRGSYARKPISGLLMVVAGGSIALLGLQAILKGFPRSRLTVLHSFGPRPFQPVYTDAFANVDGASPCLLVQGSDGNFLGIASEGGSNQEGTIFEISRTGMFVTLHAFSYPNPSYRDYILGDGSFYLTVGRALYPNVPMLTAMNAIPSGTTGMRNFLGFDPSGLPIRSHDGNYYGTACDGGIYGNGTIFRITSNGTFKLVHTFSALLPDKGGASWTNPDGAMPNGELCEGSDGCLYGTTYAGGLHGAGTIYRVTPGGIFTTLHSFSSGIRNSDGAAVTEGLIEGSDGNYYGVASSGGEHLGGTVYKITTGGSFTTLYAFSDQASDPDGPLIEGKDGDFYGTARSGGTGGSGVIYKISPSCKFQVVYDFSSVDSRGHNDDGSHPVAGLVMCPNGRLYGVATSGGPNGTGTVYRFSP